MVIDGKVEKFKGAMTEQLFQALTSFVSDIEAGEGAAGFAAFVVRVINDKNPLVTWKGYVDLASNASGGVTADIGGTTIVFCANDADLRQSQGHVFWLCDTKALGIAVSEPAEFLRNFGSSQGRLVSFSAL